MAAQRKRRAHYKGHLMIDAIGGIIGLANAFRKQVLSVPTVYRTSDGQEYNILVSPWNNGFQSFQPIDYEQTSFSQKRATFLVLKEQLEFNGVFREPQIGDVIIESDGVENVVSTDSNSPHWFYAPDNPKKNTIVINVIRRHG